MEDKKDKLSNDSKRRLDKNILRIFDSKDENDQKIMKDAPLLINYLDEESKNDFEIVKNALKNVNIPFEIDPTLVRGLDYYTKTTFEIVSGKVGSQSALCGGGRYDLLVQELGGDPTPGVGFAAGIERILLACENENSFTLPHENIDVYLIRLDKDLTSEVFKLAAELRTNNFIVEMDYLDKSVKAQMREANKLNAKFVLFVGGDEYKEGKFNLKKMETGEQKQIPITEVKNSINNF